MIQYLLESLTGVQLDMTMELLRYSHRLTRSTFSINL